MLFRKNQPTYVEAMRTAEWYKTQYEKMAETQHLRFIVSYGMGLFTAVVLVIIVVTIL